MAPTTKYPPGTPLTVGSHRISIIQYISEGGFAHVYSCTVEPPFAGSTTACLKRVVVPNKWQLTLLRQEVDAMKRLRGNAHIVSYIDSHAARLPQAAADAPQQYEVLLLMEYCSGMGLIDFMNQRLTNRLTEPEILSIMGQITTAVAMCHHLSPPLLHRDIKIENVLIDAKGTYKLCDFGSAVGYAPPPASPHDLSALHSDIMQNTTPQYRAPEMLDLARGFPIDDKSDIWALGIFLYKLCYYTTPFESPSQSSLSDLSAAILSCSTSLRFPHHPRFSPRLQNIISCCLREDPRRRPNALQLLQEVCLMQGIHQLPDVIPYSVRLTKSKAKTKPADDPAPKPAAPAAPAKPAKPAEPVDVFSKIDRSKALELGKSRPRPAGLARPKSEVFPETSRSSSLKDLIQIHVSESASGLSEIRKSEDLDRGTLEFLRSKENKAPSRQNTGGSLKDSIKRGLRRISTGGSITAQRSGSKRSEPVFSQRSGSWSKRNDSSQTGLQRNDSFSSLSGKRKDSASSQSGKRSETVSAQRSGSWSKRSDNIHSQRSGSWSKRGEEEADEKKKSSIQMRMQLLLNPKEKKVPKTAAGYGKYTDQDDIHAINYNTLSANASAESVTLDSESLETFDFEKPSRKTDKSAKTIAEKVQKKDQPALPKVRVKAADTPPPCPPSLSVRSSPQKMQNAPQPVVSSKETKKAPPPKPSKPSHLKNPRRRLSTSSETSMPDLDDLEKQFARRFPSYV